MKSKLWQREGSLAPRSPAFFFFRDFSLKSDINFFGRIFGNILD
jgi:hypothetical protein